MFKDAIVRPANVSLNLKKGSLDKACLVSSFSIISKNSLVIVLRKTVNGSAGVYSSSDVEEDIFSS